MYITGTDYTFCNYCNKLAMCIEYEDSTHKCKECFIEEKEEEYAVSEK